MTNLGTMCSIHREELGRKGPKLSIWEQYVPFTDRNSEQNSAIFRNKWPIWERTVPFTDGNSEQNSPK